MWGDRQVCGVVTDRCVGWRQIGVWDGKQVYGVAVGVWGGRHVCRAADRCVVRQTGV